MHSLMGKIIEGVGYLIVSVSLYPSVLHCFASLELTFVCEFSYEIWSSLLCWLGIQRTAGDWQGVLQSAHCQSNSSASCIFIMCISIAVYFIWRERNARKFQQVKMKPDEIVRKIKTVIYSRCFQVRKLACKVP